MLSLFNPFFLPLRHSLISFKGFVGNTPLFESIQHLPITIPAGESLADHSIAAVDIDYSIEFMLGSKYAGTDWRCGYGYVSLFDSITLRFKRYQSDVANALYSTAVVIHFNHDRIKSLQRPNINIPNGQTFLDVTINEVDLTKSFIIMRGINPEASSGFDHCDALVKFVNSTTVRAERMGTSLVCYVRANVLEFK